MDQARYALKGNLARHAEQARLRMALNLESVSLLTLLPLAALVAVERGDEKIDLTLDELTNLALFLGLTARGTPRRKPKGAN